MEEGKRGKIGRTGGETVLWFWNLVCYSFFGFLLEVWFAQATGGRRDRKCMLLPLCPVYGVGAVLILTLTAGMRDDPLLVGLIGAGAATAAEYTLSLWYEKLLGVSFWDYHQLPGNLQGRVCLPFSAAWGILSLGLVYWVEPMMSRLLCNIPLPITAAAMAAFVGDLIVSSLMLRRTGDITCLRWKRA